MNEKQDQSHRFKQAARELECDESEDAFKQRLRELAKQKPKEEKPAK